MEMDDIFLSDKYLISQKIFALRGKYRVFSESANPLLYIEQDALFQLKASFGVYRDEGKQQKVLSIEQEKFFQLAPSYLIKDEYGQVLGKITKKLVTLFKSTWNVYDKNGNQLVTIQEDVNSVVLGMMTKTKNEWANFNFLAKDGSKIGVLNRTWQIADRYLLDLTADSNKQIDRRLAICASIVLDVGENR